MARVSLVILAVIVASGGAACASEDLRATQSLNGTWQCVQLGEALERPPASGWQDFTVPGTLWSTAEGGSRYVWLQRQVSIPAAWERRRVFLVLMGARYDPHVYVDGELVGSQLDGYTPFEVEITQAVRPGGTHQVQVCCQDWGATFVEGCELPVGGWARGEPKGKVLAPIGGHVGFYGPWDDVLLVARPQVYMTDHVIVPSVRKGTLTVSGSLSDAAAGAWVEAQVLEDGEPVLALPAAAASSDGAWQIGAPFPNAHCWSPEDPHLYVLRLTLRQGEGGPVIDALDERFGFKEFWIEGPDFYLNGVKRHLLATSCWPPSQPRSEQFARRAIRFWKDANCVAFRQHTQPWRKQWTEIADEMGLMMIVEAAMWTDDGYHAYQDERFWQNYRDHLARMVKRDRNNASVVMWSLENEFLSVGNDRYFPDLERKLAELGPFVKALDPYHPITYESDLDPGGVADVIGLHYPHELPDHADYPNTCDWLQQRTETEAGGGLLGTERRDFFWDRSKPLYIGEYLWVPARDYSPGTAFFGDLAYTDRNGFNRLAKALAWFDQTVAYRRAGVSGLCPWALGLPGEDSPEDDAFFRQQKRAYEPVAAFLRDRDTRFFAGQAITRTFDVFNDSPNEKHLELRWELAGGGKGSRELALPPGGHEAVEAGVDVPAAQAPAERAFESVLLADGREVHRETRTYRVEPRAPIAQPPDVRLLLYDPEGEWRPTFEAEGLRFADTVSPDGLEAMDPQRDLLVIAPRALKEAKAGADVPVIGLEGGLGPHLKGFLGRGGRVLVLEQDTLAELGLPVELVPHASTMTFALDAAHPVLAGIEPDDLKFWRGDNYVTRREVRRPAAGGARAIAVSGGGQCLDQAPIVELPAGQGTILFVQALVGEKLNAEPVARRILRNALGYLASVPTRQGGSVALWLTGAFTNELGQLGVSVPVAGLPVRPIDLSQWGLAIADGGGDAVADATPLLRTFLEQGGTAYWHAPEPEAFAAVAGALGLRNVAIGTAQGPVTILRRDHPLLAGVSREDLCFTGPSKSWMRDAEPDTTIVDRAVMPAAAERDAVRIEAERMDIEGQIVDVGAADVLFATAGTASAPVDVPEAGLYVVTVLASGTPAGGVWPLASVRIDGREVGAVSASTREAQAYPVLAELPAGRSRLSIAFVNDQVIGDEDRNLRLDAVLVARKPWDAQGLEIVTQPASLVSFSVGRGRLVVDCVRWDANDQNLTKGHRYASGLLANLGASFRSPEAEPTWLALAAFEPTAPIAYFSKSDRELAFMAGGEVAAEFECAAAGRYAAFVRGRSTPAEGVFARAEVKVDGRSLGEIEAGSGADRVFEAGAVELSSGRHSISVRFTNDRQVGREDRNLWVTGVGFRRQP